MRSRTGFRSDFGEITEPQRLGEIFAWYSSRSQTQDWERGARGFRAIALLSVFSKWSTTVLVDLLHEEKEPIGEVSTVSTCKDY